MKLNRFAAAFIAIGLVAGGFAAGHFTAPAQKTPASCIRALDEAASGFHYMSIGIGLAQGGENPATALNSIDMPALNVNVAACRAGTK